MSEEKPGKEKKDLIDTLKEKSNEFVTDAQEALDSAKDLIDDAFSDENIENVKKKTTEYSDKAKVKAAEFAAEAKETFEDLKGNASEIASEAAEHLADFAEEAKEDFKEVKEKSKNFFQRLFSK